MNLSSKIKTAALVLTAAVAVSAQSNARMNALGYAPLADISDVYAYPVLMTGYADHIQATWGGWIVGIKQVNDMMTVGLMANTGVMTEGVGLDGTTFTSVFGPSVGANPYSHVPHLLLGFDLGELKIGADVFFEYTRASGSSEESGPGGKTTEEESAVMMHPGFRLSGAFDMGDIGILAKFGVGFPSYSYKSTTKATGVPNVTVKTESDGTLFMEMGAEVSMPLMGLDWTFGTEYVLTTIEASKDDKYSNYDLALYASTEFNVLETATAAAGYTFLRSAQINEDKQTTSNEETTTEARHYHVFNAGMENVWTDNVWFFDNFALRAGAYYIITNDRLTREEKEVTAGNTYKSTYKLKDFTRFSEVIPTLGLGVSKGFFTLDLSLSMTPGSWDGLFSGPGVAEVTGTVKF